MFRLNIVLVALFFFIAFGLALESQDGNELKESTTRATGLCDIVPGNQEPVKLLVPLYVYPGSAWDQLVSAATKIIAIINPNSGPVATPDSTYVTFMNKLNTAGVEQVGYVHTSYGARDIATVKAEVDTYVSKYPRLTGIFFDEASNLASALGYYTQLYNYVKGKGYKHVILNPGTKPDQGYLAISTNIVIFEDAGSNLNSVSFDSWVKCAPDAASKTGYKYKFSGIAHTTTQANSASIISSFHNKGMGLVYVTDGAGGCCTYNNLVSYFSNEVTTVQTLNS